MKKYLALLCASMLCVCCLALAACGGSASSSAASASASGSEASASASASSAAASSSAAAADPLQLFAGEWNMAALESQDITMAGDLSPVLGENKVTLTLNADGTGSMLMGEDTTELTWQTTGDTTAEATINERVVPLTYKDDAVFLTMEDDSFSGVMILTKDGTYANLPTITAEGAKAITSEDAIIGNWSMCGLNLMGVSMYGDSAALAEVSGDSDTTLIIDKGGSATLMGEAATWAIDANGASITVEGTTIPLQMLDDGNIIMDMSELLGTSMIIVFSK